MPLDGETLLFDAFLRATQDNLTYVKYSSAVADGSRWNGRLCDPVRVASHSVRGPHEAGMPAMKKAPDEVQRIV